MGFGLVITSGDGLEALGDGILQWLVEARVDMELSKPVRFALRFEDDICDGQPAVEGAPELAANRKLGIFVLDDEDALDCLVYGPVTEVKSSTKLGGAGSWVEIHGEDRHGRDGTRRRAGEVHRAREFGGGEDPVGLRVRSQRAGDVDRVRRATQPADQRGTDLAFVEEVARKNNMEFWLSYETSVAPLGGALTLTETAKLRTSPERRSPVTSPDPRADVAARTFASGESATVGVSGGQPVRRRGSTTRSRRLRAGRDQR